MTTDLWELHVKSFLNASWTERSGGLPLPPETLTLLWSLVVSIFALGGLLGSMASGYLAAKYGKKRCLLANNLAMLAGSLLLGLSRVAASFELMLAGRFLCGLCTGLSVPLHPQFLGEASPKTLRGFANSTASAFWSLGKVFGQVMGQREVLGDGSRWPILMALSGLPALAQLLALPFFPESPPHLFLHRGDEEGCRKAMRALWGEGRPWQQQQEMEDLRKEKQSQRSGAQRSLGVSDLLRERRLRAQLFLVVLISVAVQLSGIQAIYSYTFEVLSAAGFEDDQIPHLSLGLSTFELLSTFLCVRDGYSDLTRPGPGSGFPPAKPGSKWLCVMALLRITRDSRPAVAHSAGQVLQSHCPTSTNHTRKVEMRCCGRDLLCILTILDLVLTDTFALTPSPFSCSFILVSEREREREGGGGGGRGRDLPPPPNYLKGLFWMH
ncbi:solute carrier family 2, facilitated glucose transporter member 7-like isoform X3 [Sceloporus undulatus]|uniref:solute carrier family 2, facilitated glucose transporter member 7-like isoform X3 n=1 Tax=Sceloporus undulatus TaxID=8520 RepID=UPI001C4B9AAC|nr:solute carrier family 2, facilitated glucose transporter member 7-like isoform X3 [Sceloporus undulatus]